MSLELLEKHILYTDHSSILEICLPLQKINTHGFIFMRHFPDGRFIDLSNQLEWSDHFLKRYMQQKYPASAISDHMFIADGVSLWSLNKENLIWQEGEEYFNFGNGISIAINKEKYTDIFCFYAKKNQYEMNKFYMSNIGLLKKFSEYFLEKAEPILKRGIRNPLWTPDIYLHKETKYDKNMQLKKLNEFLLTIDPSYQRLINADKITQQELKCVKLCAAGNSAKQVAESLFLSRRTVESHLNNAKTKLQCANLSELISVVLKYCELT